MTPDERAAPERWPSGQRSRVVRQATHYALPAGGIMATSARGFGLVALMIGVGIVAILAGFAVVGSAFYQAKARVADIMESVDAVRKDAAIVAPDGEASLCADVIRRFARANLSRNFARMDFGLEAVSGGFRPVLTVCATAAQHGPGGVQAARTAHELLNRIGVLEQKAVLSDTVVSFAVGLTPAERSVCRVPFENALTACGEPVAASRITGGKAR